MPKIVVTHAVVDVDRWLKGKAERVEGFGAFATDVTDYVAADGSNNVAITGDISDMAAAQEMMTSPSPDAAATAERHGVIPGNALHREVVGRSLDLGRTASRPSR
jgi:hypothetical protein